MKTIRVLADAGVDLNAQVTTRRRSGPVRSGYTPLHVAAACNWADVVKTLIEIGCDPAITNAKDETPIEVARREKREDVIVL